jgi:hypothetical protein
LENRLAAAQRQARQGVLVTHPLGKPNGVLRKVVVRFVPPEATTTHGGAEGQGVDGNDTV